LTKGQARAWREHREELVLEAPHGPVDMRDWFGRPGKLGIEIGFGMGQALVAWAQEAEDWNLLGIDVYQPGIGALLLGVEHAGLGNIRVLADDARRALAECISPGSVDEIRIFFPDPWPKKRHHKRRLIQSEFVASMARCLAPGARLLLATDWEDYAQSMLRVMTAAPDFRNLSPSASFSTRPNARPLTRFEARGLRLGHSVWDLAYEKIPRPTAEISE
jgi:tRNA (guanine-N7-)-methyltransferase